MAKKIYSKSLGMRVGKLAKPELEGRTNLHVISSMEGSWAVVAEGNKKSTKLFPQRIGAIRFAKNEVAEKKGEVVIHNENGQVAERISYSK